MVTGLKEGYRKTKLSMTMKGQRIASIDLAKGFCISIVMCFHIKDIIPDDCMLAPVAFSACMLPPFYFLSGLCFKERPHLACSFRRRSIRTSPIRYLPAYPWRYFGRAWHAHILPLYHSAKSFFHTSRHKGPYSTDKRTTEQVPDILKS